MTIIGVITNLNRFC